MCRKNKIKLSLFSFLLSTNLLMANAYTDAIEFNDSERIDELNSGYENISINSIDKTSGLTPIQYSALNKPEMISSLLSNYDINLLLVSPKEHDNALQLLVNKINSPDDSNYIRYTIKLLFFAINQPSLDWNKLFGYGTSSDVIKKLIDHNIFEILYFIKSNNIPIDNDYYISYAVDKNPLMSFYLYPSTKTSLYIKAIKKMVLNDSYDDLELLFTDHKLDPYLEETLTLIKEHKKLDLLELFKKQVPINKFSKLNALVELKIQKTQKNSVYYAKIKKLKNDIDNLQLKEQNYQQKLLLSDKAKEIEKLKIETKYRRKIEYLKNKSFKEKMSAIHTIKQQHLLDLKKQKQKFLEREEQDLKAVKLKNNLINKTQIDEIKKLKKEMKSLNKLLLTTKEKYQNIIGAKITEIKELDSVSKKQELKNKQLLTEISEDSKYFYIIMFFGFLILIISSLYFIYKKFKIQNNKN